MSGLEVAKLLSTAA